MTTFLLISAIATWGVLIFNILLLMGLIKRVNQLGGQPSKEFLLEEAKRHRGEIAPPFTAKTPSGETVTLDSFVGQDVAFLFLSPTCQPCVEKIPMLNSHYPQAKAAGIEMVVVNVDPHISGEQFINDHNIEIPVITAPQMSNPFASRYYAVSTPAFCLVDATGKIRASGMISATHKVVEAVVEKTVGRFLPQVEAKAGCNWVLWGCCNGNTQTFSLYVCDGSVEDTNCAGPCIQ